MGKIKVLHFPIANSYGGITHYALENWKWMDKIRFQCDFVTMSKHLDFEKDILALGSRIYYVSCYAEDDAEQFVNEIKQILSNGYDVVHIHTKQWKSFAVEKICREQQISKVIVHSHSTGIDTLDVVKREDENKLHKKIKKKFNESMATDFWACSKSAASFLFGEQIPVDKIKIMPNAIDLKKFAYNSDVRRTYRKEYGLENCFVVGNVGRFVYQKNHEFLINVFYELSKQVDNAKLVLLGDGELFTSIKTKVSDMGIDDRILFLGKRNDVNNWYQAMDVFCLTSRFEGLPISMVEAQAAGLPCLGSEYITDEVKLCDNVFLFPLNIQQWIDQLKIIKEMERRNNYNVLVKHGYEIRSQIKKIENEYEKSISYN